MVSTAVVCDADTVTRRFLVRALERAGLAVTPCDTAAACEAAVASSPPDLVVLSILLPDLDGLALTRRLRAARDSGAQRPRIVMASVLQAEQRALEAGADAFVLKPVAPATLADLVTRLLSAPVRAAAGTL